MISLFLDVTAFPDVQAQDNILSLSSDHSSTFGLSFPVCRSPQNLKNCLIYVKLQNSITDQSELAPKWFFTISSYRDLNWSARRHWTCLDSGESIHAGTLNSQWKGVIPSVTDSLLSTEKRVRIWDQPRGTTVGALCLSGSLAAAWAGRFQTPGGFLGTIWDSVLCNDNAALLRKWKAWGQ